MNRRERENDIKRGRKKEVESCFPKLEFNCPNKWKETKSPRRRKVMKLYPGLYHHIFTKVKVYF